MLLGIIFLLIQTFFAITKPKYFVFLYFLFLTSFFGFLSKEILIAGNEIGFFYQHMLMLISWLKIKNRNTYPSHVKFFLNVTSLLYLFGIIYPVIGGSSSIIQSIIASKEFSGIFLAHYLFSYQFKFSLEFLKKLLNFVGYGLSIILALVILWNFIPPEYVKAGSYIEYDYPTILSLFLFVKVNNSFTFKQKLLSALLIIVWVLGMMREGHSAIMLTTLLGLTVLLFNIPLVRLAGKFKWIILSIICALFTLLFFSVDSQLNEILETPSFKARSVYNIERLELIKEQPVQGYGFLHKSALDLEGDNPYMESLAFIDSGYIDLLGKFGFLGMLIYFTAILLPIYKGYNDYKVIGLKLFILQYFIVSITWSVFTFSIGIIAIALAIFLDYQYKNELENKDPQGIK
ncbi:hypothetical protein NE848_05145 [Gramella jeungdoensis]|uniref:O-antigen ligase domain-containing protein n=1 Tax=Gramella jeungdoensis TaxID=708091 RepID=A0ABT0Z0R4_9FLAO|nr:hypothetical protein [Gramella jeungdoensis]MCM8568752.1 hypothetical protein [Gramella jeungdoensis]